MSYRATARLCADLWRSDDRLESVAAVVFAVAVVGWFYWQNLRGGGRRTAR
jgi:hypothetical protein